MKPYFSRGSNTAFSSSAVGIRAIENCSDYVASKFGVLGLMKAMALELGRHQIRVNAVCPTMVGTDMMWNDSMYKLFLPDLDQPTLEDVEPTFRAYNLLGTPWVETTDVSEAIVWLCSDAARYLHGVALPVDAGTTLM